MTGRVEGAAEEPVRGRVPGADPAAVVALLAERGATLAVAESLTGGLLGAVVTSVPGASAVFRGGVVAYATEVKAHLLAVDRGLLARCGAVHVEVAGQMARGVRDLLAATYGLATTGAAGPEPLDGRPPGTVCLAVADAAGVQAVELHLPGDRAAVREATVAAALSLLVDRLSGGREQIA